MLTAIAYSLGALFGMGSGNNDILSVLLRLPVGNALWMCGAAYSITWVSDHWKLIKRDTLHKVYVVLQILVLLALFVYLVWGSVG